MTPTPLMEACANTLRGLFIAWPEHKLVVSDLSNIEGRVLPWLAGEEWKLQAFRDYDTIIGYDKKGKPVRLGPDIYVLSYANSFRVALELVTAYMRQQGKGMELSMGYQGGVGAFINVALAYGLDLDELARAVLAVAPADVLSEARSFYGFAVKQHRTLGLSMDVFVACDVLKRLWRRAHPNVVRLWDAYEDATRNAITHPDTIFDAGRCRFVRAGNWLRILLPSGRELSYPSPRVDDKTGEISYMGMNQYSRKWSRLKLYGGKIAENIDQAVSRDVLASAMPRAEACGYRIVLTVHDELITNAHISRDDLNAAHLSALLATNEEWNRGLPLAAAGFDGPRYKKEG